MIVRRKWHDVLIDSWCDLNFIKSLELLKSNILTIAFITFLGSSSEWKFSPAEFVEADAVRIITAGRSRNHVCLYENKHISVNTELYWICQLLCCVWLTSLRLKVISRLLQKKSQNSGYMSNTSSTSSLWILWRSQYVRARTSALDFPGRAYRLMGSPNISFFPVTYTKHPINIAKQVWLCIRHDVL